MNVTVHYERQGLEALLRPIINWYELNLMPGTIHDHIDNYGVIANIVYDALGDFILEAAQGVLDRNFDIIVETKLTIPIDPSRVVPETYREFLSTRVYPVFERIYRQNESALKNAIQYLANHGMVVDDDNSYFYHHTPTAGVFVLRGMYELPDDHSGQYGTY